MKIEKIDENQVKITLSCAEMLTMNSQNISEESQNIWMELLATLEDEYRFSMINHQILLEMVPSQKDGCEIFLTKTESHKQVKKEENLIIASFVTSEDAFYAGTLSKKYLQGQLSVYLFNNAYYLVLQSPEQADLKKVRMMISDFGDTIQNPALMESVLQEYGTLIINDSPPLLT